MKKFLFTLVALLTAGSAFATNEYWYMDPIELSAEDVANGATVVRPINAHFEAYVSSFQVTFTLPEGVTVSKATRKDGLYIDYLTEDGEEDTYKPSLGKNTEMTKFIVSTFTELGYTEDGECYGVLKWGPGEYLNMWEMTFEFPAGFEGGQIAILSEPSVSGDLDNRPEFVPTDGKESTHYFDVTVPEGPQPAPVPTLTWNEDSYTMTAACEGHDVVLMINGEAVENPYTVAQTYEEQTITFVAYTVANADESGNSTNVEQTVTVPAKEKDYAPAPIFREVDGKVYAEAEEGYEVVMMLEGEVCENPYTLPAANYEADQVFHFSAYTVKKNEYGNSETKEYTTTVYKLEKNTPTDPVIFTETTEDRVIVTVAKDPNTDGQLVYDGQPSYARGEQDYEVTVTAYTTEGATYKASGVTTKTFTVPALEQVTPPEPGDGNIYVKFNGTELPVGKKIIFVYENGANSYSMGTVSTKADPVAVEVVNGEVDIEGKGVTEFTVGGGEVAFGTDIKQYTLEYSAGFLAYNSSTNFKTLTSIGTYDNDAYWRLQTGDNGYVLNNAATASRYIRKHATTNKFGPYAKNADSEEVVIYVEKSETPALQDLAGTIEFGEPTADGKVSVTYNGNEAGVVVTVEGYDVVDGMIQLPEYGTYTLNATATADGYNPLNVEGTVTWSAPVLPTLGGYFVWGVLDEEGHFTVEYRNFDYDGPYTLVVKDEDGNVMNPEVGDAGEYYQAAEGTHTYTVEVTAPNYQVKTDTHEYTYTKPTYAPKPMLSWNEETFTMTAYLENREYSNDDIELYMNNEKVENPKTVAQTYQPQALEFKARTIGKDGDENSDWAYMNVTVPAKEKTASAEPTISVAEGADAYVITGQGTGTVVMYDAEGNEIANPYTVERTNETQIIIITVENTDADTEDVMYKPTSKTFTVTVPAKEEVVAPDAPEITINTFDDYVTLGASDVEGATVVFYQCDDETGANPRVINNPTNFNRETENYDVFVYAVATNAAGETSSVVTKVVIPAKVVTPPDPTSINEMNGGKAVAGVRYFNMAGQEMQEANGMTIVVTTYTDGTTSAVKVMK